MIALPNSSEQNEGEEEGEEEEEEEEEAEDESQTCVLITVRHQQTLQR